MAELPLFLTVSQFAEASGLTRGIIGDLIARDLLRVAQFGEDLGPGKHHKRMIPVTELDRLEAILGVDKAEPGTFVVRKGASAL